MRQAVVARCGLSRGAWAACGLAGLSVLLTTVVLLTGVGGPAFGVAFDDLGELVLAAGAAATTWWRARHSPRQERRAWGALAVGCGSWALGEAIWSWYEVVQQGTTPFPSLADLGFLLFPAGAGTGLFLMARDATPSERGRHLLDSLTVTASLALVFWRTSLGAVAHAPADGPFAFLVSLAYPASDLVLLTLLVIVMGRKRAGRGALALIGLGIAAIAVADSAFAYLTATGRYDGGLADLGWVLGFALLAVAPLPRSTPVERPREPRTDASPSLLPYLPVVLAAVVVGDGLMTGQRPDHVELALAAVTVALVLVRQYSVVMENTRLLARLSEREEQLRHLAFHDGLTGLPNRALFHDRVAHALDLHRRDLRGLAVLFCDLDDFKLVNDTLGHQAGDELLVRVAERLRGGLRQGDTLARLGGDEFAVLLEDGGDPWVVAEQIIEVMSSPYSVAGQVLSVQTSIGLAVVAGDDSTPSADVLLAWADMAMYAAKRTGKGSFRAFEPGMELAEVRDDALHRRLASGIADGSLSLVYQPITEVTTGRLLGFEALARWQDGDVLVPPDVFVPLAERTGLIAALTESVLEQVCAQLAAWDRVGARQDFTVSVNVSPQRVVDRTFPDRVLSTLRRHHVRPERLVLEITESGLLSDLEAAREVTTRLDAQGVRLSLDDFGVGFSSLTYLSQIPLCSLKIDRAFVGTLGRDEDQARFPEAVLQFGAHLGLEVIAEGVERTDQLERLRELGCSLAQGFLLGRPEPAARWTADLLRPAGLPHQRAPHELRPRAREH